MRVLDGRVVDVAHDGQARAEPGGLGRGVPGPQQARHLGRAEQDQEEQAGHDGEFDGSGAALASSTGEATGVHRFVLIVTLMPLNGIVAGAT